MLVVHVSRVILSLSRPDRCCWIAAHSESGSFWGFCLLKGKISHHCAHPCGNCFQLLGFNKYNTFNLIWFDFILFYFTVEWKVSQDNFVIWLYKNKMIVILFFLHVISVRFVGKIRSCRWSWWPEFFHNRDEPRAQNGHKARSALLATVNISQCLWQVPA